MAVGSAQGALHLPWFGLHSHLHPFGSLGLLELWGSSWIWKGGTREVLGPLLLFLRGQTYHHYFCIGETLNPFESLLLPP